MPDAKTLLTPKQLRIIEREVRQLLRAKSFMTPKPNNYGELSTFLARKFDLPDKRSVRLTDLALAQFRRIVRVLDDADISMGQANYSDIWSACKRVVADCLANGQVPDSAVTFVQRVTRELEPKIDTQHHVIALYGAELKGIKRLSLGAFRIIRPSVEFIESYQVRCDGVHLERSVEAMRSYLWIHGTQKGTETVAASKFQQHARLMSGLLAIVAAATYEHGATAFRIGVITSPEDGHGRSIAFSWGDTTRSLSTNHKFVNAQRLTPDVEFLNRLHDFDIEGVIKVLESESRTEVEEALVKAVYWYSDAHRDTLPVMQLVKYWSCIETFFSADQEHIVQAITTGLAAVLVYGGYRFVPVDEYRQLRKRLPVSTGYALKQYIGPATTM